jgi:hypothetical protein
MSYLNADRATRDVHLSSPTPASLRLGYHKILKPVKGRETLADALGGAAVGVSEGNQIP